MKFIENNGHSRPFPPLRLKGARVARGARDSIAADVEIQDGRVRKLLPRALGKATPASSSGFEIDLDGLLIIPGLVNAHDHLEFNLFPRLGKGSYPSYAEWADDIYRPDRTPLREHLAVPKPVRLWWGGLKNLLCGVTTVCHHNPYEPHVFGGPFPVRVLERYGWAHSLRFDRHVASAFRSTPWRAPFIIHLAEGTDKESRDEIFELDQLGALSSQTVIVHGVGLDAGGRALFDKRGASIVWCPTSNTFTLGSTLDGKWVGTRRSSALGSDSALTAAGDLLDEAKAAIKAGGISPERVYDFVTSSAASVLGLAAGEGFVRPGGRADLTVIRSVEHLPSAAVLSSSIAGIELVIIGGRPRLMSEEIAACWPGILAKSFERIQIGDTVRLVDAPVRHLYKEARKLLPELRLAGKQVSI